MPAKQSREPYNMSPLPDGPWMEVSVDFKVLPNSEYLLVITDDYSRYPIVEIITSTAAKVVIPVIDKVFAEFGVPHTLKSDNGSPFQSDDFAKFANYLGFKHRRITPYWPRANAECERFMKTLGKCIKAATAEGRSYKQNLHAFLLNYRATPHTTTGISPATALFGRAIRTRLPELSVTVPDESMRQRDDFMEDKMRKYADSRLGDHRQYLDVGDKVLIPNCRKGTIEPRYSTEPHEVVHIKGSMITAKRGDQSLTRNVSFFKRIPDNITRGSCDIDHAADTEHAEDQSEIIPVPVPHHAGEHQPRVDAPTVMPVPIVQSPQLTSVPNNDDGVVKTSRGRIIRKPTYFKDFVE